MFFNIIFKLISSTSLLMLIRNKCLIVIAKKLLLLIIKISIILSVISIFNEILCNSKPFKSNIFIDSLLNVII